MKMLLVIVLLPTVWAVFCGLWKTRQTQTQIVVDTVEIGAEYAQDGLKKARKTKKTK